MIGLLMTYFLKFHIYLMLNNKTTIENLEKKGVTYRSLFDIGNENNFYQVFGTNKWLWPFPVVLGSGKPLGDGIYWPSNKDDDYRITKSPTTKTEISPNKNSILSPSSNLKTSKKFKN